MAPETRGRRFNVVVTGRNPGAEEVTRVEQRSLYERLGGVNAIAMVVDRFSDAIVENCEDAD